MRITLILLALICLQLNAQDRNKAALTAGSEFLDKNEQQQVSITNARRVEFVTTTNHPNDQQIGPVKNQAAANTNQNGTEPVLYIVVFLLAGIALFFFTNKNKTTFNSQVHLEEEEEQYRKKELWKAMAEPEPGD